MSASKDISGRHGSWTASPTIDYGGPLSKRAYLGVSASVNFYGKGFVRYYYDIDAEGSAASGLPVYDGAGRKATAGKYTLGIAGAYALRSEEHTSELQSLMRISYAVLCLKKKKNRKQTKN